MRRSLPLLLAATLLLTSVRPAVASDTLEVSSWLKRPGVKLLVVEFYADWCEPCKRAVPFGAREN